MRASMFDTSISSLASRACITFIHVSILDRILNQTADITTHTKDDTYVRTPVISCLDFAVKLRSKTASSAVLMLGRLSEKALTLSIRADHLCQILC